MSFAVGSLVKARGREWVVLPESTEDLLLVRPLGGSRHEDTGIYLPLEKVEPAHFGLPQTDHLGDYRSCRLLRDAIRLGFRSSAGPFRSFAQIAVEPRPYQLVPLLMALKLDPVRLLIADDVGIGKTIEACLVARELMDRGEEERLVVLSPRQLAEQWQDELRDKFNIDAELVLPSTVSRLERGCLVGQSLFEIYPHTIVSIDFIKSDRRRDEFIRSSPNLVIVDEAHSCSFSVGRGTRHQRHQLVKELAANKARHLILVTATPHSGKEDAFRSLLGLLDEEFLNLPDDLSGEKHLPHRKRLAANFVQRQRADIKKYMGSETIFPDREEREDSYTLSPKYSKLFERVLDYARETIYDKEGERHKQRVRWWSALALLRSLSSSPAAAAETLRNRASTIDTETDEEADELGRRLILDIDDEEGLEVSDIAPGSDISEIEDERKRDRRKLQAMAKQAEELKGKDDEKLAKAVSLTKELIKDGFNPIIFCRFIPTAEYVADELRKKLKGVEVASITGMLPPVERKDRIKQLAKSDKHVLVCTDCLSEGINLQEYFDAVFHYDLSWNPTRHEQRAGRVDRYGQNSNPVRVLTYYSTDNQIDGVVLEVLLRKHKAIRSSLGISIPMPADTDMIIEAVFEGLLLREKGGRLGQLGMFEDLIAKQKTEVHLEWDIAADREKRSRTLFAHETIKVDEVAQEVKAMQDAIGSGVQVESFMKNAAEAYQAVVTDKKNLRFQFDFTESPKALIETLRNNKKFTARFELPVDSDTLYLTRTHPIVEGLSTYVMETALDDNLDGFAKRAGVISTKQVERRTTLLLVRFRYHIVTKRGSEEKQLLAEDCQVLAFSGSPQNAEWLDKSDAEKLLEATPDGNINPDNARDMLNRVIEGYDKISPHIEEVANLQGQKLLDAHQRVRKASQAKGVKYSVEPKLPPDVLGIYIYLPAGEVV